MILIKEVILCQVVIAHWAIFEMTFIGKELQMKKEFEISKQPDEEKKKSNSVSRLFEEGIRKCT